MHKTKNEKQKKQNCKKIKKEWHEKEIAQRRTGDINYSVFGKISA